MSRDRLRPSAYGGGLLLSLVLHNSAACASVVQAMRVWIRCATETTVDDKKKIARAGEQTTNASTAEKET